MPTIAADRLKAKSLWSRLRNARAAIGGEDEESELNIGRGFPLAVRLESSPQKNNDNVAEKKLQDISRQEILRLLSYHPPSPYSFGLS
jgi:hypothetical protein